MGTSWFRMVIGCVNMAPGSALANSSVKLRCRTLIQQNNSPLSTHESECNDLVHCVFLRRQGYIFVGGIANIVIPNWHNSWTFWSRRHGESGSSGVMIVAYKRVYKCISIRIMRCRLSLHCKSEFGFPI